MNEVSAPCSSCIRQTNSHKVLHERAPLYDEDRITTYAMLECSGCHQVCLGEQVRFIPSGEVEQTYYPSPVSRKEPDWVLFMIVGLTGNKNDDAALGSLLHEIYQAVRGGQYRLAAMGIRALLEQIMVSKVGDLGSFEKQLDAFEKGGYISFIQRDAMTATLEVGHAAMHRAHQPTEEDVKVALDIVEGDGHRCTIIEAKRKKWRTECRLGRRESNEAETNEQGPRLIWVDRDGRQAAVAAGRGRELRRRSRPFWLKAGSSASIRFRAASRCVRHMTADNNPL